MNFFYIYFLFSFAFIFIFIFSRLQQQLWEGKITMGGILKALHNLSRGGRPDPHQPLALSGLPGENPQVRGQPLLVLWGTAGHDALTRPTLQQRRSQTNGVGRARTRQPPGAVDEP
jgi:hypothetical protein